MNREGSSWIPDSWREQDGEQRFQQADAALSGVVHELELADVQRQLLLRDAAVRAQPGAQQRPRGGRHTPSMVLTCTS